MVDIALRKHTPWFNVAELESNVTYPSLDHHQYHRGNAVGYPWMREQFAQVTGQDQKSLVRRIYLKLAESEHESADVGERAQ